MLNLHFLRKCLLLAMRHVKPHQVGSSVRVTTLTLNKGICICSCNLLLPGVQILCPCDVPMLLVTLTAKWGRMWSPEQQDRNITECLWKQTSIFLIRHWWVFVFARSNIHYIWLSVQYIRTARTEYIIIIIIYSYSPFLKSALWSFELVMK